MHRSGLLIAVGLVGVCITVPSTQTDTNRYQCELPTCVHSTDSESATSNLSGTCTFDLMNDSIIINVTQENCIITCIGDPPDISNGPGYMKIATIVIGGTMGVTNLMTIIVCGVALYFSRRKIAYLKQIRKSLHHQTETEERVVNNPAYEEQCSDLDADEEYASSRPPNKLSAQYSNLGPAHYESVRGVNQRLAMKGDLSACSDKGRNKRPLRHTEPVNCPHTYYHEVHSDELRQWSHRVVPSDSHNYSRLYH